MTIAAHQLTREDLIAFEERVKEAFLAQQIHAPVHLSGGNERHVLELFKQIRPQDWVFSTWRNHYHALLKGIPAEELFQAILEGRSMYIASKEHKFICSSIVGGILPIACGVALGAQRRGLDERVWVFCGDMAAETGIFLEAVKYAGRHKLPVTWVIEDNGVSTNTPTQEVWGQWGRRWPAEKYRDYGADVRCYKYERIFPHTGVGQWVTFG